MPELTDIKMKITTEADTGAVDQAEKRIGTFSQNAVKSSQIITAGFLAVGAAIGSFAGFGIKMAGDMEMARQGFVALLGSADKADATMARIKKEAASTPFELPGLVAGTQALAAITKDGNKAIDMLMDVGKAVAVSGKGQVELDRIVLNLQQISSTGKITAMDIKQFQGAIPIFNDIVKGAGMTIEQLQNADNAAELLGLAFKAAGEKGGIAAEGFTAQAGTWNQLFSNFKDNIGIIASEFVKTTGIFELAKTVLGQVVDFLSNLITPESLARFKEFMTFLGDNQGLIAIFAGTILALMLPALWGMATALWAVVAPLIAFAAPIIAIGLLVAALYMAWQTNFLGIQDIVKVFTDWFMTYVWPTINNIFNWIKSALTTLGQFFTNVFNLIIKPLLGLFITYFNVTFWLPLKALFGLVTDILAKFGLSWSDVFTGIKNTVFAIFQSIVNEIKSKVNMIIGFINMLINGANSVGEKIPNYTKMNTIPGFANGVENFSGGLAIVGERGPELVNLPRGSSVTPNDELGKMGGANVTQINNIYTSIDIDLALRNLVNAVEFA